MNFIEAFDKLDQINSESLLSSLQSLDEGYSMPYALIVMLNDEWKLFKGLDVELTEDELDDFLLDKPEYADAKVILTSEMPEYIKKKTALQEQDFSDREYLIAELTRLGYNYNFDKYSNRQLYCILNNTLKKIDTERIKAEMAAAERELAKEVSRAKCSLCDSSLTDGGYCPVCDDGATDLNEGNFNSKPSNISWKAVSSTSANQSATYSPTQNQASISNIVTIVYDRKAHKLRARADDGVNGEANVAFPNNLRTTAGQQYEVDKLIWNGKNYRVSGNIKPV